MSQRAAGPGQSDKATGQTSFVRAHTPDDVKPSPLNEINPSEELPLVFWVPNASGQDFQVHQECSKGSGTDGWL